MSANLPKGCTEEFSFSLNGEDYQQASATRIEAMKAALESIGTSELDMHFWTGRNVPFAPNNPAEDLIEQMQERASDECGEHADNYLTNVTSDEEKELNDFILGWLGRVEGASFWSIDDAEQISVGEAMALIAAAEKTDV